jgi:hypothetical protein
LVRIKQHQRLEGLAATGYCAALKTYFHGVREHLIFTPQGRVAFLVAVPGNRHDVIGLYALLKTPFTGALLGDCAYQPNKTKAQELKTHGLRVHAEQRSNAKEPRPEFLRKWIHTRRSQIERRIGLFDKQFHADRTLNRSVRHYHARRWTKALAHNCSRHINLAKQFAFESVAHFNAAA